MSIENRIKSYGKVFSEWNIDTKPIGEGSSTTDANDSTLVFKIVRKNISYEEVGALKVVNIISKKGNYNTLPEQDKKLYEEEVQDKQKSAERELQLMYQLRGTGNIVSYVSHAFINWQEGMAFGCDLLIQMDLYDNLYNYMKQGKIYSETEIMQIGMDICKALCECHKLNIIHRDIKPQNIFINKRGEYMLGDFGISRILENKDYKVTSTGTMEFSAPEQFSGSYDHRVDIYSLGLTLYQLANKNHLPFSSETGYVSEEAIRRRVSGEKLPPLMNVSRALEQVIMKACAHSPEDRYRNAEEFYNSLCDILAGQGRNVETNRQLHRENPQNLYKTSAAGGLQRRTDAGDGNSPYEEYDGSGIRHIDLIQEKENGKRTGNKKYIVWGVIGGCVCLAAAVICVAFFLHDKSDKESDDTDDVKVVEEDSTTMEETTSSDVQENMTTESITEMPVAEEVTTEEVTTEEVTTEIPSTEETTTKKAKKKKKKKNTDYILPDSDKKYLTMKDLKGLSQKECKIARNELYARHGRKFQDPELQAYFDKKDWYLGFIDPEDFVDSEWFNEYEMANRDLIVEYEKDKGYR